LSKSGSKKTSSRPRELSAWQQRALGVVAESGLAKELAFGGGAALAAVHLHHRTSEDLDFFLMRPVEPHEAESIGRVLATSSTRVDIEVVGPRTSLLLRRGRGVFGRIDFAFYPFDPIGRRTSWRGLAVESLLDMTVNKVQAILTRLQPRDFVDLFFLLREGPQKDLDKLLDLVRAKFDVGAHRMGLAARLLLVHDLRDLPRMIRPVKLEELVAFFELCAHDLTRSK
jgi:predicted nucleotidyltransferase component of viral defense system